MEHWSDMILFMFEKNHCSCGVKTVGRRTKAESGRRPLQNPRQAMMEAWTRVIMGKAVTNGHLLDMFEDGAHRT